MINSEKIEKLRNLVDVKNKENNQQSNNKQEKLEQNQSYSQALKQVSKGFTLIELMITVAIVGVLSAIAIPAYKTYAVKAKFSEGLLLAEGYKGEMTEYISSHGSLDGWDIGFIRNPSSNISSIFTANYKERDGSSYKGVLVSMKDLKLDSSIRTTISYYPKVDNDTGSIKWECVVAQSFLKYAPSSCSVL